MPGITELLIILLIIALLFGTRKLRNIGGDLGGAIKGFRSALKEDSDADAEIAKEDESSVTDDETKRS